MVRFNEYLQKSPTELCRSLVNIKPVLIVAGIYPRKGSFQYEIRLPFQIISTFIWASKLLNCCNNYRQHQLTYFYKLFVYIIYMFLVHKNTQNFWQHPKVVTAVEKRKQQCIYETKVAGKYLRQISIQNTWNTKKNILLSKMQEVVAWKGRMKKQRIS